MSSDLKQDILDSVEDINDLLKAYEELFERVSCFLIPITINDTS